MNASIATDTVRQLVAAERAQWREIALSTAPIEAPRAIAAVHKLYHAAGFVPPKVLILDSPYQCRLAMALLIRAFGQRGLHPLQLALLRNLRHQLIHFDRIPWAETGRLPRDKAQALWQARTDIAFHPDTGRLGRLRGTIEGWANLDLSGVLPADAVARTGRTLAEQLREPEWRKVAARLATADRLPHWQKPVASRWITSTRATGAQQPEVIGMLAAHHEVKFPLHAAADSPRLEALTDLCRECGPAYLLERWAFVSNRPAVLRLDQDRRPHNLDGPAAAWRDGWKAYAWHGTRVPGWVIEEPARITPAAIMAERNAETRRCMIERIGAETFIRMSGAEAIGKDVTGTLWRRRFADGDIYSVVEVVNGSPEPDGTFKHYFLRVPPNVRSAREAVAWTYGMRESEYRPEKRT